MLAQQKAEGGLAKPGVKPSSNSVVAKDRIEVPKLSDAGISKDLSSRAQKLAAVPEAEFEAEVGQLSPTGVMEPLRDRHIGASR